ncbi:MAG: FecR domain-containing protein [Flavitalea sp.]
MSKKDFNRLLEKYVAGTLSSEEMQELSVLLHSSGRESDLKALIDEQFTGISFREKPSPEISEIIFQKIMQSRQQEAYTDPVYLPLQDTITPKKSRLWLYAAAAVLLLSGGGATWFFLNSAREKTPVISQVIPPNPAVAPPSSVKAAITLANGQVIELDSAGNGTLALQGNTSIIKLSDGQLIYKPAGNKPTSTETVFNTLNVPRGSRVVNITLSDGTRVWLNAASSLRYPASFEDGDRKVEVTGEVYFEVASLPLVASGIEKRKIPFIVKVSGKTEVSVLGTHFNIQSYADDPLTAVTLLEGSVKVSIGGAARMLTPGQQAKVNMLGNIAMADKVDLEHVMAWKNGYFKFDGADIKDVMRQMARWYDVEVVYQGTEVSQHFRGNISRNVDAAKVFKMLEATDEVHFKIENKKIIVTP